MTPQPTGGGGFFSAVRFFAFALGVTVTFLTLPLAFAASWPWLSTHVLTGYGPRAFAWAPLVWKILLAVLIYSSMRAVSCLSDPVLRTSLSPPFEGTPEDLCSADRAWQFYMMCLPEMIEAWAPVIQAIFTAAMTIKSRKPQAPRQTWIIDEAGQLKGYDHIARMFTYGAGSGIRPVAVFQHGRQMRQLGLDADQIIASSAGLQITFGVRDIDTAKRVSDMLGSNI